jgi:hypothetical protein
MQISAAKVYLPKSEIYKMGDKLKKKIAEQNSETPTRTFPPNSHRIFRMKRQLCAHCQFLRKLI